MLCDWTEMFEKKYLLKAHAIAIPSMLWLDFLFKESKTSLWFWNGFTSFFFSRLWELGMQPIFLFHSVLYMIHLVILPMNTTNMVWICTLGFQSCDDFHLQTQVLWKWCFVTYLEVQWCQLESLLVLFYEVKVPCSGGYSTI